MLGKVLSLFSAGVLAAGLVVLTPAAPASAADVYVPITPQTGTVTGTFTDRSGRPIAGARVWSDNADFNGWGGQATTDAQGRYLLEDVPAGPLTVAFSDNHVTQYAPGRSTEEEAQRFTVVPGLTTVVNERKVPTGTVQGRLTDAAGNPVADGRISVDSDDYLFYFDSAQTDADGRWSISDVPAGAVLFEFRSGGFHQWSRQAKTYESAKRYTVRGNQTLTVDESMRPLGTLTGQIDGLTGGGVSVSASEVNSYETYYTSTDATGRFSLPVQAGQWRVRVATRQWVPGKINEEDGKIFRVPAGGSAEVAYTVKPTGSLRVSLRTGSSGVGQYQFGIWHDGVKVASTNGTDAGYRTFENLLPGDYVFGYDRNAGQFYAPGTIDIEDATVVQVRPGREKRIEATHPAGGTLAGRVTLPNGEPAPGIKVTAEQPTDGVTLRETAETGTDGEWRMTGVFPESYHLTLTNPARDLTQDGGDATVTSGATTTVNTTWLTGGSLTVTAVDAATGAPVSGYCVAVIAKFGDYCTDGSTVSVPGVAAGPTLVTLTPTGSTDYVKATDVPVTITGGGNATLTVPVTLGGRFNVELVDHVTGAPVEHACVLAFEPGAGGDNRRASACANGQGKATSGALAPGTYQLFALPYDTSSYGAQWYRPEGGTGDQREATKIQIKAGKTAKVDPVLLDQEGSVSGVVRDPAGQPVPEVNVEVTAYRLPGLAEYPRDDTDAQGRYTIDHLGPYAWPLLFTPLWDLPRQWSGATGNRYEAATVPVISGATGAYDMTLSAGTRIRGTATVAPGGTQWTGGVLQARNLATGDLLAVGDVPGAGGAYEFTVIGGNPVTVDWYLADPLHKARGRHDANVPVPASGTKRLDLTIG